MTGWCSDPVCGCGCEDGLAVDDVRSIRDALNVWLTEADRSGWGRTAMSDEISDERAEEMAERFERMEPAGTPEITPLGELMLAVMEFRRHNTPDGYDQALMVIRIAFYGAGGA